jgi:hypothetical protein
MIMDAFSIIRPLAFAKAVHGRPFLCLNFFLMYTDSWISLLLAVECSFGNDLHFI